MVMEINKQDILNSIIHDLKKEFAGLAMSAMAAKDAATNEESRSENKYDTRGLEASYLAGAQASRAQQIRKVISEFQSIQPVEYSPQDPIGSTALVEVLVEGVEAKWFFILPQKGGMKINCGDEVINTLSIESPLGQALLNKNLGESFEFSAGGHTKEYEITQLQ